MRILYVMAYCDGTVKLMIPLAPLGAEGPDLGI